MTDNDKLVSRATALAEQFEREARELRNASHVGAAEHRQRAAATIRDLLAERRDAEQRAHSHEPTWTSALHAPREWEGTLAWEYQAWSGEVKQNVIPPNYSRVPEHCAGVYFIPINVPSPPKREP